MQRPKRGAACRWGLGWGERDDRRRSLRRSGSELEWGGDVSTKQEHLSRNEILDLRCNE